MKPKVTVCMAVGFVLAAGLSGCTPDKMEFELYTSDIRKAGTAVVEVPLRVTFSTVGEDTDGSMLKASKVAKRYLGDKADVVMSKSDFGDVMVIKCTIPMGTADALKSYLASKHRPIALTVKGDSVILNPTEHLKALNQDLRDINMMFDIDMPAKSTVFRFIGDMESAPEITAIAVFVDKKPELLFHRKLARRASVDVDFKGDQASVYCEIAPQFIIKF